MLISYLCQFVIIDPLLVCRSASLSAASNSSLPISTSNLSGVLRKSMLIWPDRLNMRAHRKSKQTISGVWETLVMLPFLDTRYSPYQLDEEPYAIQ